MIHRTTKVSSLYQYPLLTNIQPPGIRYGHWYLLLREGFHKWYQHEIWFTCKKAFGTPYFGVKRHNFNCTLHLQIPKKLNWTKFKILLKMNIFYKYFFKKLSPVKFRNSRHFLNFCDFRSTSNGKPKNISCNKIQKVARISK